MLSRSPSSPPEPEYSKLSDKDTQSALQEERAAWARVQRAEGSPEASAHAWNEWLMRADALIKAELDLKRRSGR